MTDATIHTTTPSCSSCARRGTEEANRLSPIIHFAEQCLENGKFTMLELRAKFGELFNGAQTLRILKIIFDEVAGREDNAPAGCITDYVVLERAGGDDVQRFCKAVKTIKMRGDNGLLTGDDHAAYVRAFINRAPCTLDDYKRLMGMLPGPECRFMASTCLNAKRWMDALGHLVARDAAIADDVEMPRELNHDGSDAGSCSSLDVPEPASSFLEKSRKRLWRTMVGRGDADDVAVQPLSIAVKADNPSGSNVNVAGGNNVKRYSLLSFLNFDFGK
eukprot:180379_1